MVCRKSEVGSPATTSASTFSAALPIVGLSQRGDRSHVVIAAASIPRAFMQQKAAEQTASRRIGVKSVIQ